MTVHVHDQIVIDARRDPLVHVLFGDADLAAVQTMFAWANARFDAGEPYALAIEWMGKPDLSGPARAAISDWMRANGESIERWCVAQAYVMDNVLKRMILRSVLMLGRNKVEHRVVPTNRDAERFLEARLREHGLDCPAAGEEWARTRPTGFA